MNIIHWIFVNAIGCVASFILLRVLAVLVYALPRAIINGGRGWVAWSAVRFYVMRAGAYMIVLGLLLLIELWLKARWYEPLFGTLVPVLPSLAKLAELRKDVSQRLSDCRVGKAFAGEARKAWQRLDALSLGYEGASHPRYLALTLSSPAQSGVRSTSGEEQADRDRWFTLSTGIAVHLGEARVSMFNACLKSIDRVAQSPTGAGFGVVERSLGGSADVCMKALQVIDAISFIFIQHHAYIPKPDIDGFGDVLLAQICGPGWFGMGVSEQFKVYCEYAADPTNGGDKSLVTRFSKDIARYITGGFSCRPGCAPGEGPTLEYTHDDNGAFLCLVNLVPWFSIMNRFAVAAVFDDVNTCDALAKQLDEMHSQQKNFV
jgi:hypothetical protein